MVELSTAGSVQHENIFANVRKDETIQAGSLVIVYVVSRGGLQETRLTRLTLHPSLATRCCLVLFLQKESSIQDMALISIQQ